MAKTPKRPRDPNQLARMIVDLATGESPDKPLTADSHIDGLGGQRGVKGGQARSETLSADERAKIARKAALARWNK